MPYSRLVRAAALVGALTCAAAEARAQSARDGSEVYQRACAACHGADGRGGPPAAAEYPVAAPAFTECSFASREPDADWLAVSHDGGPVRGFSRLMPAFGEALTRQQLEAALAHIRTFCADDDWPRGELNLPRALVTTKAYPEDEAVLTFSAAEGAASATFVYERRIGPRNQFEIVAPLAFAEREPGDWTGGVGDLAFAFKRALHHSLPRGRILSAALEVVVPTGSTERNIGGGATIVEPFLAFGQLLPADAFLQAQAGAGFAAGGGRPDEAFWRAVVGRTWTQGEWGRAWSPMLEILGEREIETGGPQRWDLLPQVQVTLNTRQHVMLNAGVRVPLNRRRERSAAFLVYVLWDWFDGGFFEGW